MRKYLLALLLVFMVGCSQGVTETTEEQQDTTPTFPNTISVNNQAYDGSVTIAVIEPTKQGWIVIHADDNVGPGTILGKTAIPSGESRNVVVNLEGDVTEKLYAMLHVDEDPVGVFDFPGVDGPAAQEGEIAVIPFTVTFSEEGAGSEAEAQQQTTESDPTEKFFEVEAKQWEFNPSTITVNEGDTVRLSITSIDVTHGFALPTFGVNERLEPGSTVDVEFVADQKGTFSFFCNVACGPGHGGMRGELVVE